MSKQVFDSKVNHHSLEESPKESQRENSWIRTRNNCCKAVCPLIVVVYWFVEKRIRWTIRFQRNTTSRASWNRSPSTPCLDPLAATVTPMDPMSTSIFTAHQMSAWEGTPSLEETPSRRTHSGTRMTTLWTRTSLVVTTCFMFVYVLPQENQKVEFWQSVSHPEDIAPLLLFDKAPEGLLQEKSPRTVEWALRSRIF